MSVVASCLVADTPELPPDIVPLVRPRPSPFIWTLDKREGRGYNIVTNIRIYSSSMDGGDYDKLSAIEVKCLDQ